MPDLNPKTFLALYFLSRKTSECFVLSDAMIQAGLTTSQSQAANNALYQWIGIAATTMTNGQAKKCYGMSENRNKENLEIFKEEKSLFC